MRRAGIERSNAARPPGSESTNAASGGVSIDPGQIVLTRMRRAAVSSAAVFVSAMTRRLRPSRNAPNVADAAETRRPTPC
jgi:hypothetical protein